MFFDCSTIYINYFLERSLNIGIDLKLSYFLLSYGKLITPLNNLYIASISNSNI